MSHFILYDLCFQDKFLGNTIPPVFAVIVRAVTADQNPLGYQLAAYIDKSTGRVQLVFTSIDKNDKQKICIDSVLLSKHKVTVRQEE